MPPRRRSLAALGWFAVAGLTALGAGCAAHSNAPASAQLDETVFRSAGEIFSGFSTIDPDGKPTRGDRVLLGIDIQRGNVRTVRYLEVSLGAGRAHPWQVEYTRHGEKHSVFVPAYPTRLTLHDDHPDVVNRTAMTMPDVVLTKGFFDAARVLHDNDGVEPRQGPDAKVITTGLMSILCMAKAYSTDETLTRLLLDTVEQPSIIRFIFGSMPRLVYAKDDPFVECTYFFGGWIPIPAYRVAVRVVQGSHALVDLEVVVVEPVAPLGLCGGVVAVDARNPSHPDRTIRIRLLGARRGPAPTS